MMLFYLCLFLAIYTASPLVCKNCNIECDEPIDETCLEPGEEQVTSCLTEIFKDDQNQTLYQKKCVLYKRGTKFECPDYPGYKSLECVTCNTDFCNKAPPTVRIIGGKNSTISNNTTNTFRANVTYA